MRKNRIRFKLINHMISFCIRTSRFQLEIVPLLWNWFLIISVVKLPFFSDSTILKNPVYFHQLCYDLSSWSDWAKVSYTPASPLKQSHRSQVGEADVLQEVCRVPSVLTLFMGWAGLHIAGSYRKQCLCLSLISSSLQAQTVLNQFFSTHSSDPFAVARQKQRNSP